MADRFTDDDIKERLDRFQSRKGDIPIRVEMPENPSLDLFGVDFLPDSTPFEVGHIPDKERPGFFRTLAHEVKEQASPMQIGSWINDELHMQNPLNDEVPEGWTPYNEDMLKDVDKRYWYYITRAQSPMDQQRRRQHALERMQIDEEYKDGSMIAKLTGGLLGGIISPEFWIPVASFAKYAKTTDYIIKNTARAAPSLAVSSALHAGITQATDEGGNLEEGIWQAGTDALAGTFLIAGGAGLTRALTGGKLHAVKQAYEFNSKGIGFEPRINENGEQVGLKPVIAEDTSVGAAEVSKAEEFANSKIAEEGLLKMPGLLGAISLASPLVRMANHPFGTVRSLINRFGDFSFETVGKQKGQVQQESFERKMQLINQTGLQFQAKYNGWESEAFGIIDKNPELAMKSVQQQFDSNFSPKDFNFNREVALKMTSGIDSSVESANTAGSEAREVMANMLHRYQRAKGFAEQRWQVANAVDYLTFRPNVDQLQLRPQEWREFVVNEMVQQDEIIRSKMEPIESLDNRIKGIRSQITQGIDLERNKALLDNLKKMRTQTHDDLIQEIRDDFNLRILLEDRNILNSQESEQLKEITQPLQDAVSEFNQIQSDIRLTKEGIKELKREFEETIDAKNLRKNQKAFKEFEKKIQAQEQELEQLQTRRQQAEDRVETIRNQLHSDAHNGLIEPKFYTKHPHTGEIMFHEPDKLPKFRPTRTREEWAEMADAYRNTYLGSNPEQIMDSILSSVEGVPSANPLQQRALMIRQSRLIQNNFGSDDVPRIVNSYLRTVGRKASIEESLKNFGITKSGVAGVQELLSNELAEKEAVAEKITDEKKRKKELKRIRKEFKSAQKHTEQVLNIALGKHIGSETHQQVVRNIRNLQVSTMLGGVPLTQITDLAAVAFKHGMLRFLRDGLAPMVKSLNGSVGKDKVALRAQAEEALMTLEHVSNGYANKLWNSETQSEPALPGKVSQAIEKMAHMSGNLFGTNYVENALQRLSANTIQSRIMQHMFDFERGKLKPKDKQALLTYGLDPNKWSKRFVEAFKGAEGESGTLGGHQSYWYRWTDNEAKNQMAKAVHSAVRDTVIKGGLYDSPLISKNPYINLFFSFTGWAFSAFNRFTVPLMQRPDAEKASGMLLMFSLGALEDPLRRWTRGEEADIFDDKWAIKALSNTGVFSLIHSGAMWANAITGREFLQFMENDRQRDRTLTGMLGGPAAGLFDNYWQVATMFASGKINQSDLKRFTRSIPLINAWYLRGLNNKMAETMFGGFPETRRDAPGWTNTL